MIYVRIEMWPSGDRERARLLQEMTITNVGGDAEVGSYDATLSHSTTYRGNGFADPKAPTPAEVWKKCHVERFQRKTLSPAHLVNVALGLMLPRWRS